jgi:hypothetical protein
MAEVTGTIKVIGPVQEFANNFTKLQLVVTSEEQYPNDIPIDFLKDKTALLDDYHVGDEVKVSVNIKGSFYNERYFVGLNGWRVERLNKDVASSNHPTNTPSANQAKPQDYAPNNTGPMSTTEDDDSELPF